MAMNKAIRKELYSLANGSSSADFAFLQLDNTDLHMVLDALRTLKHVSSLKLDGNRVVCGQNMQLLVQFLLENEQIQSLELYGCDLGDREVVALCTAIGARRSFRFLDIGNNTGIGDVGVAAIAEMLRAPTCHLQRLALWRCSLSAAHCVTIINALALNRSLKSLDIWGNQFNDGLYDQLRVVMHRNCTLSVFWRSFHIDVKMCFSECNMHANNIINERTPPLHNGLRTSSGDFDELPNEMVCAIAERVWPTEAALTSFVHVCARFRDCMLSDYVVKHRHGRCPDTGAWTNGDWRFFYRRIALDANERNAHKTTK
jgi:hypothetical protein